jgi:hypothetical protein
LAFLAATFFFAGAFFAAFLAAMCSLLGTSIQVVNQFRMDNVRAR